MRAKVKNIILNQVFSNTRFGLWFARVSFFTLFIWIFLLLGVQFPYVQNQLVDVATQTLSEKTGFPTKIERIEINWFDEMSIKGLSVYDTTDQEEMIHVREAIVDYKLRSLLSGESIMIDEVSLDSAHVVLRTRQQTNNISEWIFRIIKRPKPTDSTAVKTPIKRKKPFIIEKIILKDCHYENHLETAPQAVDGFFNSGHLVFDQLSGTASHFSVSSDTIALKVHSLQAIEEYSKLQINDLQTDFMICPRAMNMTNLHASVGESILRDSIAFQYDSYKSFSDFWHQIRIEANLDHSIISLQDLTPFIEGDFLYDEEIMVSGDFNGTVADFNFTQVIAQFGENSTIKGEMMLSGLPEVENSFMLFSFPTVSVLGKDLDAFTPEIIHPYLKKTGKIRGNLTFAGFLSDFAISGGLNTALGKISPDLSYRPKGSVLKGWLSTKQFDIGKLIEQETFLGKADINLYVDGKGANLNDMYYQGRLNIREFEVNKYKYNNAQLSDFVFSKDYFSGNITVQDSLLAVQLPFEGSLADTTISLDLDFEAKDLAQLNFMQDTLSLQTHVRFDWKGDWQNSHLGNIILSKLKFQRKQEVLAFGEIKIESDARAQNGIKTIDIVSDVLNANFKGNFKYREYSKQINRLKQEFLMSLYEKNEDVEKFYTQKQKEESQNFFSMFDCQVNDLNKVLTFWNQDLYISDSSTVKGIFREDKENMRLAIRVESDSISMYQTNYTDAKILLNTQKKTFDYEFPLQVLVESKTQQLLGGKTKDLSIEIEKEKRALETKINLKHAQRDDYFTSASTVLFSEDSIDLAFKDLNFKVFEKLWIQDSTKENRVIYTKDMVDIRAISLNHNNEQINVFGQISDDSSDKLNLGLYNLDISTIGKVIGMNLSGLLNVDVDVSDLKNVPLINGSVKLFDTHAENIHIGDVYAYSQWNAHTEAINLNASIEKDEVETLLVLGNIYPYKSEMFDLEAVLANTDLKFLEFFLEGVLSDIKGNALGLIKLKGNPSVPKLEGDAILDGLEFTVDYLKTTYKVLNDRIDFSNKGITFNNISLVDTYNNYGTIDGGIFLEKGEWLLDLKANYKNLMLLNTQETDNELFYGQAYGTGNLHFKGPFNDLQLDITARSNKNTKVYIPIEDTGEISDSYIHFINPKADGNSLIEEEEDEMGFKLNMNLDITPDAYCQLIFDKATQDLIEGRGEGKLQIQMDTKGAFLMFGNIDIQEGIYNFNYALNLGKDINFNVLAKKFFIEPNSSIVWAGDPYEAVMNITTSYEQVVSLANLVNPSQFPVDEDGSIKTPIELRRKYPTKVQLMMSGQMLSPVITFGIDVYDYPKQVQLSETGEIVDLDMWVNYMKQKVDTDEAVLNAQVMNLMIFKQFLPLESHDATESDNLAGNLSELVSNQLSTLLSNLDENMQIDLNLGGFEAEDLQQMQLRFAYSFLGGRLKLIRDGGFVNEENKANVASVLGDITLEMELTPQGNLKAKVYVKQNFNNFNALTQQQSSTTQGVSIMHTKSFNSFGDFFRKRTEVRRLKKKQRKAIRDAQKKVKQKQSIMVMKEDETLKP